jgi:hypothetical protein
MEDSYVEPSVWTEMKHLSKSLSGIYSLPSLPLDKSDKLKRELGFCWILLVYIYISVSLRYVQSIETFDVMVYGFLKHRS